MSKEILDKLIARGEAAQAASLLFAESQIRDKYEGLPEPLVDSMVALANWVYSMGFADAIATFAEISDEEQLNEGDWQ